MDQLQIKQLLQQKIFNHSSARTFNAYSRQVLHRLAACHTARLGLHVYGCAQCGHKHYQYHSCGNRHCPNCGGLKREQWLHDRMSELLPTAYFHIVFTLPQQLRSITMGNRRLLLSLLFEASTHTLRTLGANEKYLGATPGIITVLHTHGQQLSFHPHVHCIVSGGGFRYSDEKWIPQRRAKGNFLFPRRAMEKIFKAYFLDRLSALHLSGKLSIGNDIAFRSSLQQVRMIKWNVYAKAPFGGPRQILEYLGRYTHKTAISTHRILDITDQAITFHYKDYADGHKQKVMTLSHEEFLRRFEQHILPKGFVRIRHSGFLSHQHKHRRLRLITEQLRLAPPAPKTVLPVAVLAAMKYGTGLLQCPACHNGRLRLIATYINTAAIGVHLVNIADLHSRGSPKKSLNPHEQTKKDRP